MHYLDESHILLFLVQVALLLATLGLKIIAGLAAIPVVLVVEMGLVGLALSSEPQFVLTEAVDAPPDRVFQLVSGWYKPWSW